MSSSPSSSFTGLTWPDYAVIATYFLLILAVGIYSSWKSNNDSMEGYFLSSRNMRFLPVGASIFASNIGASHFIGLAGSGAASGIGVSMFDLTATYPALMLGWLFVPVYMASGVYTMPEYLRKRFGGQRIRTYMSFLSLLLYIFTKISADLYAGALFITYSTKLEGDWANYISSMILLAIVGVFTIFGGLTAVMWTDLVSTVLMIIGACIVAGISFHATGGYDSMILQYFDAVAENRSHVDPNNDSSPLCGEVNEDAMHLFRDTDAGPAEIPWTGLTGLAVSSIWYWCTDQVIVQRSLASKSMIHAKGGTIFAGYLKLLPLWIMIFPGMAARVLFPNEVACADPDLCYDICSVESGCTNLAFVMLVTEEIPEGVRGLMLAVLLSALMSSLSSIFNSAATIFTIDIYAKLIRRGAGEAELLISGKLFILLLLFISILWIPIINAYPGAELFSYIQSTTSYLAPPICAVFLLAVFWPRCNEPGAFWSLMVGLAVGLTRFVLEVSYRVPPCGTDREPPPDWWYAVVGDVHYLHFGFLLWLLCLAIAVAVSLVTEPIPEECLYRLTYWSRKSTKVRIEMDQSVQRKPGVVRGRAASVTDDGNRRKRAAADAETAPPAARRRWGAKSTARPGEARSSRTAEARTAAREAAEFLYEEPAWKRFANINAAIVVTITAFIYGFYW